MRRTLPCALVVCILATTAVGISQVATRQAGGLYSANPNHLWNRIHRHFFVRVAGGEEHGFDRVDPLLWPETRHLVTGASHKTALALLDEFLTSRGETLIADPLKRAVFQHDLWAVFDWLEEPYSDQPAPRHALMSRLARVMRRVALTSDEISRLPDTYEAAVSSPGLPSLPRDFFGGSWVRIETRTPVAPHHAFELSRSAFHVLWRLPGNQTLSYLRRLWEFPQPFVPDESFTSRDGERRVKINPALPQVPDWTQLALVRTALLIDRDGRVVPSRLLQSIQLRTFNTGSFNSVQTFAEFTISRAALFAGQAGGLRAVGADELDFITFSSMGMDAFERNPAERRRGRLVLDGCSNCHSDHFTRLESIRSLPQFLRPHPFMNSEVDPAARWLSSVATEAKTRRADFGALQALWR
jgi:hypothetical protein